MIRVVRVGVIISFFILFSGCTSLDTYVDTNKTTLSGTQENILGVDKGDFDEERVDFDHDRSNTFGDELGFSGSVSLLKQGGSLCIHEQCFTVEVADTEETRARGLMGREFLASDHGMIFVFERGRSWRFWMKNTLISLDMLWLDKTGTIVYIEEFVPPCEEEEDKTVGNCPSYGPPNGYEAWYVVEFVAGSAGEHGIAIGDKFIIK